MTTGVDRPVVLITGATGGIGFHTAAAVARAGMDVVVTGRDAERGQHAVSQLKGDAGHPAVDLIIADALDSRQPLRCRGRGPAGRSRGRADQQRRRCWIRRSAGDSGRIEATLALNFAGPFALTTGLLDHAAPAQAHRQRGVECVSDVAARSVRGYRRTSRLCRPSHMRPREAVESPLHARARASLAGSGTSVVAVNPGMAWTPGIAAMTPKTVPHWRYVWPIMRWIQRRASAESAATSVARLAIADPPPASGSY